MQKSKKRTKNKQELSPKSGAKKKPAENKIKIKFSFQDLNGVLYSNGTGRLKICTDGFLTMVIMENGKWKNIKGKLVSLKITKVPK